MTKKKGVLSPEQSQFLGGVLQAPLIDVHPQVKESILNAYFATTDSAIRPDDLDDLAKTQVGYAIATAEKAQELGLDASPEEIVAATPSPFELDDDEAVEFEAGEFA